MFLLRYHREVVADTVGQDAYRRAMQQAVSPGAVVLDVGTGTGLHAVFACQAGASRVYAIEPSAIASVAREICRANGCGDRVTVLETSLETAQIDQPVDVIVGHHELANLLALLPLARDRFLKAGGALIPASLDLFVAPIDSPSTYDHFVRFWTQRYDVNLEPIRVMAASTVHRHTLEPHELLADGACIASINFAALDRARLSGAARIAIARRGTLHGLSLWTVRWLRPDVPLSNGPGSGVSPAVWGHLFVPLREPAGVQPGEVVAARVWLEAVGGEEIWKWDVTLESAEGRAMLHDAGSNFGFGLSPTRLRKYGDDYAPRSSRQGAAMRFVLERFDGRHAIRDIEAEISSAFPDLFPRAEDAVRFVAGVIAKGAI